MITLLVQRVLSGVQFDLRNKKQIEGSITFFGEQQRVLASAIECAGEWSYKSDFVVRREGSTMIVTLGGFSIAINLDGAAKILAILNGGLDCALIEESEYT